MHHTTKSNASTERGSGALRGACDTLITLTKTDDVLSLSCPKQKELEAFEDIRLSLVRPWDGAPSLGVRLSSEMAGGDDEDLTDAQGRALHVLCEMFRDSGATSPEWEAATLTTTGMHRSSYFRAKKERSRKGFVDERGPRFYPTAKATSRMLSRGQSRIREVLSREAA